MSEQTPNTPELGLAGSAMETAVDILEKLLADESVLYQKLRKYHWNVTGPHFHTLHVVFEEQYTAIEPVIDEAAERIRQYGALAIGTFDELLKATRLEEHPGVNPDARTMVSHLVADHEAIIRNLRNDIDLADDIDDFGLEDYLTGQLQAHQKMAWMLRTMLEDDKL